MSDQPKVSEQMVALVLELLDDTRTHERNRDRYALVEFNGSKSAVLSAIAELEQRAEKAEQERDKWREVAVAYKRWTSLHGNSVASLKEFDAARDRLDYAIAAIGPAWAVVK